ncbi:MAG: alpha/beta fold hydrolase [Acidimicrobiia bacterium]|nr:alpha/beta fold hydrolase [Acidimicrobiia bacterium]
MESVLESDGIKLAAHWGIPTQNARRVGVIVVHGIPVGVNGGATFASSYPEFADRITKENGVTTLFFLMRGVGDSPGEFSVRNWKRDIRAAIDAMEATGAVDDIILLASSLGGVLCLEQASFDRRITGLILISTPSSVQGWIRNEKQFISQMRVVGLLHDEQYPSDPKVWIQEFKILDPLLVNNRIKELPIFILHGDEDLVVDVSSANLLEAELGVLCEKRIINNAGHRLRYDPRAVASIFGWIDRFMHIAPQDEFVSEEDIGQNSPSADY